METKGQILTINPNGVFIDNVPTTQYNGYDIRGVEKYARGLVGGILEIQVMQSNLEGNLVGLPGNPIPNAYGRYTWMCAKTDDNIWSDWLFRANYGIGDKGK
ncbi:MAG: hypothetical protein J6T57_01375, partial [Alphaproteobacteria bacterium]|nr:hypothetical protein [Alphaproteobacteria bacterium]